MKKIFMITAISLVTLGSCTKEVTSSEEQSSTLKQSAANTALESADRGAITFDEVFVAHHNGTQFTNPCTGEVMTLYGDVQFRFHGVTNDNKSMTITNSSVMGLKAVGTSGRTYTITGAGIFQESSSLNGVLTSKVSYTNHFITAGAGNNFIFEETYYFKVDADGNVTYQRDPVVLVSCK